MSSQRPPDDEAIEVVPEYEGVSLRRDVIEVNHRHVVGMTPETAAAMVKISENEHALPAREKTKREWLATVRHFGVLAVVCLALFLFRDALTNPYTAGILLGLLILVHAVLLVIKALKRAD